MHRALIPIVAVAALLVPTGVADAHAGAACPPQAPDAAYIDLAGTVHRQSIDCLGWWDVDIFGRSDRYRPGRALTRGQHAALLARLLDATGMGEAGSGTRRGFDDVTGHPFEAEINRLASLDVVHGRTPSRFDPAGPIRRDQMASLIVQLHEHVYGESIRPGRGFADTEANVHEDNIRKLVAAGITRGRTEHTYEPAGRVTRGQIATFTMRHTALLIETGDAQPLHLFDPISRSGSGDAVVDLAVPNRALAVAEVTHRADAGPFTVWTLAARGGHGRLVTNAAGSHRGTSTVNFGALSRGLTGLDITAAGGWTIELRPAAAARRLSASGGDGAGDDVVGASDLAGGSYTLIHDGAANFIVTAYGPEGRRAGQVVNRIGSYGGTHRIPADTHWLEVHADGPWSLTPAS